jgi:hypothetical protein
MLTIKRSYGDYIAKAKYTQKGMICLLGSKFDELSPQEQKDALYHEFQHAQHHRATMSKSALALLVARELGFTVQTIKLSSDLPLQDLALNPNVRRVHEAD